MSTIAAGGQLDLLADLDATERAARLQRNPSLFDTGARGFPTRLAAFDAWVAEYDSFDSSRRSHAWRPLLGGAPATRTQRCRPTALTADLRCAHYDDGCCCVGDLVYRGACRCCDWEVPIRDEENAAVEDAHDHAEPGWRDLPLVPRPPAAGTGRQQHAALQRWTATVEQRYPTGWLQAGGPIRTRRSGHGTRHVPNATPFGGHDLCGAVSEDTGADG